VNRREDQNENFEARLLARLKAHVAERGAEAAREEAAAEPSLPPPAWRRRGPRLALVGALALAAIVVAIVTTAGGGKGSTAFAVEPRPGGGVTIRVYSLEDAAGVEAALEEAGIHAQVNWLDAGMVCREPHFKPATVRPGRGGFSGGTLSGPGGVTIAVAGASESHRRMAESHRRMEEYKRGEISDDEFQAGLAEEANFTLDPQQFGPGQSVVISGTPIPYNGDPEGGSVTSFAVAEGPVEPCVPVPAPPSSGGGGAFGLTAEGGPGYAQQGDSGLGQGAVVGDLRRAAGAAAASGGRLKAPRPGQYLYTETKEVQLEAWLPRDDPKGSKAHPRYFVPINDPRGRYALVPVTKQEWMGPGGRSHVRETLGQVEFLSAADQRAWEAAGSPPPWEFDPSEHHVTRVDGRPTKEFPGRTFRGRHEFTYLARVGELPTEPEALRLAVEHRRSAGSPVAASPAASVRGGASVERLLEILREPLTSPALRAAAFRALAEIPGVEIRRGVSDSAGRKGDAIGWTRGEGFGRRFIFDPGTGTVLADAEMIFGAKAAGYPQVPDDTVFRETAYLKSAIVDSIGETGAGAGG
jgi:hypothetical protein